jgi:transcription antitermination factor NusA-like protein
MISQITDLLNGNLRIWHALIILFGYWLIKGGEGFKGLTKVLKFLYSLMHWVIKKPWMHRFESRVNSIAGGMSKDVFDKHLSLHWSSAKFILNYLRDGGQDGATIYVNTSKSKEAMAMAAIEDYVESIYPNIGYVEYSEFRQENISHVVGEIAGDVYNGMGDIDISIMDEFKSRQRRNDTTEEGAYKEKLNYVSEKNYYMNVFLDATKEVDKKTANVVSNTALGREMIEWFGWVYEKAKRSPGQEEDLEFRREYFKYSVILVAKRDTLKETGVHSHVDRIESELLQRYSRIYIVAIRKTDIANVRHILYEIDKNNANVILEKRFTTSTDGAAKYLAIVDNQNVSGPNALTPEEELRKIIEDVVPPVRNGKVHIVDVARIPGRGSKVLVESTGSGDPVSLCVGEGGIYPDKISKILGKDEYVSFIPNISNPRKRIIQSLFPIKDSDIKGMEMNFNDKISKVFVPEDKMGLVLGEGHSNIKLSQRLLEWQIQIIPAHEKVPVDR